MYGSLWHFHSEPRLDDVSVSAFANSHVRTTISNTRRVKPTATALGLHEVIFITVLLFNEGNVRRRDVSVREVNHNV